jgi:hypothetical protein
MPVLAWTGVSRVGQPALLGRVTRPGGARISPLPQTWDVATGAAASRCETEGGGTDVPRERNAVEYGLSIWSTPLEADNSLGLQRQTAQHPQRPGGPRGCDQRRLSWGKANDRGRHVALRQRSWRPTPPTLPRAGHVRRRAATHSRRLPPGPRAQARVGGPPVRKEAAASSAVCRRGAEPRLRRSTVSRKPVGATVRAEVTRRGSAAADRHQSPPVPSSHSGCIVSG